MHRGMMVAKPMAMKYFWLKTLFIVGLTLAFRTLTLAAEEMTEPIIVAKTAARYMSTGGGSFTISLLNLQKMEMTDAEELRVREILWGAYTNSLASSIDLTVPRKSLLLTLAIVGETSNEVQSAIIEMMNQELHRQSPLRLNSRLQDFLTALEKLRIIDGETVKGLGQLASELSQRKTVFMPVVETLAKILEKAPDRVKFLNAGDVATIAAGLEKQHEDLTEEKRSEKTRSRIFTLSERLAAVENLLERFSSPSTFAKPHLQTETFSDLPQIVRQLIAEAPRGGIEFYDALRRIDAYSKINPDDPAVIEARNALMEAYPNLSQAPYVNSLLLILARLGETSDTYQRILTKKLKDELQVKSKIPLHKRLEILLTAIQHLREPQTEIVNSLALIVSQSKNTSRASIDAATTLADVLEKHPEAVNRELLTKIQKTLAVLYRENTKILDGKPDPRTDRRLFAENDDIDRLKGRYAALASITEGKHDSPEDIVRMIGEIRGTRYDSAELRAKRVRVDRFVREFLEKELKRSEVSLDLASVCIPLFEKLSSGKKKLQ